MLRQRGFTLVEVLVALLVMAVLAAMAWQGVGGLMRGQGATKDAIERALRLNTVIAQWDQDLGAVQETQAVNPLAFDGATLRLTRRGDTGMQLVVWSLQGGSWLRWASPLTTRQAELQEAWLRSQQLRAEDPDVLKALEGVSAVQLYFYRGNGWSNAQSSGDLVALPQVAAGASAAGSAPTAARVQLPSGVRLAVSFGEQVLTRDVMLPPVAQ